MTPGPGTPGLPGAAAPPSAAAPLSGRRRTGGLEGRLARLGFVEVDRAASAVEALELADEQVQAVARAADPDLALSALQRMLAVTPSLLGELAADPVLERRLVAVLGASTALGDHLVRHPRDWRRFGAGHGPGGQDGPADISSAPDLDALRAAYRCELALLAALDLRAEVGFDAVGARLAELAEQALSASLRLAREALPAGAAPVRLAVIGMGKCGGRELNYVSDVDVIFVAQPLPGPDGTTDEPGSLRTAARLAEAMMRGCAEPGLEPSMFPIDAALRPEGKAGPLVRTLSSHEGYYRRWASGWEFQALLKARPVAGDGELGRAFVDVVAPLVWSAASRPGFVADVQAMRQRVEASVPRIEAGRQVKLGPGGLRDVEFAVQLLQLVHGRYDKGLRSPTTLRALEALARHGYVGRVDAVTLAASYRFLRTLEHRLQLQRLRRTHTVPTGEAELRWLARSMAFRDAEALAAEHARHAREVRRLHEKLFYRPLLEAVAGLPEHDVRLTPEAARIRLQALGFAEPGVALRHIQALTTGVSRTATIQRMLLPTMLGDFADAANPDAGLLAYRRVSDALGGTPWYLRLLRDEGHAAERLARLLATSPYVTDLMTRAPESVALLHGDDALEPRSRDALTGSLLAVARRWADPTRPGRGEAESGAAAARAIRRMELLRIACADLLGLIDVETVGRALSDVTCAVLEATLEVAIRTVEGSWGRRLPIALAVIAMGRLGGHEMAYSSDADVLFVHEAEVDAAGVPAPDEDVSRAARAVAEEVRRLLGLPAPDPPLVVDMGLRPEGRSGPLTRSLASYAAYYRRWSLGWEAQALLRASTAAGDTRLADRFLALADSVRYPPSLSAEGVREVARLKRRMELERMPRRVDRTLHLKLGPGGLTDVEWAAQLLQLRHAGRLPALRTTSTLPALREAAAAGLLGEDERDALVDAWTGSVRARNAVLLTTGRSSDVLPADGRALAGVARALGYPATEAQAVLDDHRRRGSRARAVVDALFAREEA